MILVGLIQQPKTSSKQRRVWDVPNGPLTGCPWTTSSPAGLLLLIIVSSVCPWLPTTWLKWSDAHRSGTGAMTRGLRQQR